MPGRSRQELLRDSVLPRGGTYALVRFLASKATAEQVAAAIKADPQVREHVEGTGVSLGVIGWSLRVYVRPSRSNVPMQHVVEALQCIVRLRDIVVGGD